MFSLSLRGDRNDNRFLDSGGLNRGEGKSDFRLEGARDAFRTARAIYVEKGAEFLRLDAGELRAVARVQGHRGVHCRGRRPRVHRRVRRGLREVGGVQEGRQVYRQERDLRGRGLIGGGLEGR